MNTKHTPGPWNSYAAPAVDIHIGPCVGSHAGDRLANVIYRGDSAQSNADAALIAAAPDMLAALQLVTRFLEANYKTSDMVDILPVCRAAIEDATGVQS